MQRGKIFFSILVFLVFLSSMALANGLNLNSLGSRALAMGGAFVGLADDFSTIFWNPAGIALFDKKYFGFYGVDIIPKGAYELSPKIPGLGKFTLVNAETAAKHYLAGMVAYYHPVSENVVAGLSVYTPSGLGAKWDGADFAVIANNDPSIKWESKIGMVTIAPGLAYKINDQVFVGAALNINYAMFDIAMHAGAAEVDSLTVDLGQYEESMNGWGYGATFGVLYKPNEKISLGATFRTASTVKFSGEATISKMPLLGANTTSDLEREITWPMWIAGGIAFRPVEKLILTADLQWTQWSRIDVIETTYKDPFWSLMMAMSGDDERPMYWDDALQIRFGAEYWSNNLAFRAGYYYDPSPAPDETMNVLLPSYDFHALTGGLGYYLNGLQIDFAVEYLMGKERSVRYKVNPTLEEPYFEIELLPGYETAMPGTYSQNILAISISAGYRW
ncbi:MAG: outer membrane protein transport protein [Candidatus Aminicenantes bacterium]|nr:MAG: outer membrane protein transport protein [Candidatus Aminicenantes bacterium]